MHALDNRRLIRDVKQSHVIEQALRIDLAWNEGERQKRLQFRGKCESSVRIPVIERLDPYPVSGAEEQVALLIMQHEGKHAVEIVEQRRALLFVQVNENLGIRIQRPELVSMLY